MANHGGPGSFFISAFDARENFSVFTESSFETARGVRRQHTNSMYLVRKRLKNSSEAVILGAMNQALVEIYV